MILTDEQHKTFEAASRALIQWLCQNCHAHVHAVVTPTRAELIESVAQVVTNDYVEKADASPVVPD
jgi:hypothetical protein